MRIINNEFVAWLEKQSGRVYSRALKRLDRDEFLVVENNKVIYVEPVASYHRVPNYIVAVLNRFAKANGYDSLYFS